MIHLLLLIGAAGASSSASIEEKPFGGVAAGASTAIGVGAGSAAEIDTPGRALAAGKCCKRAAKHKRKKLQLKMKWETCKKAADATPTCETCAPVKTCGEPEEGKQFMFADVTASTACGDLCATACFEDKTCGDPEDGKQFKDDVTAETACGTTCETTCFEEKGSRASGSLCDQDDDCASGFCQWYGGVAQCH